MCFSIVPGFTFKKLQFRLTYFSQVLIYRINRGHALDKVKMGKLLAPFFRRVVLLLANVSIQLSN